MQNNGLLNSLFVAHLRDSVTLDDAAEGRMATLAQTWQTRTAGDRDSLWDTFLKQALSYLEFVPPTHPAAPGVYPLYEDWNFSRCISILYLVPPGADIDDTAVGCFYPAKLLAQLREHNLNWGILTDGATWRLYAVKSSRPYEDYVELPLQQVLERSDEAEYGLFERFFHKDSFVPEREENADSTDPSAGIYTCRLDKDREAAEEVLEKAVKAPLLAQVDEVLQYICNGFIFDTQKPGEAYTEEERGEIFDSAVKLIYRCLFLFYAEARRLLPSDPDKVDLYHHHSIQALCAEAREFRWGARHDMEQYSLWQHLKGLINAVNDGDPEYGIMGYNGGLFDDEAEKFLGQHHLRNDFLSRALYLLAYVEPYDNQREEEYAIPYEDLEVRHLGELYESILESTVQLADADRIRRRTRKGVEIMLASQTTREPGDRLIKKGEVYFGESALERKQTGSYYTPESLVRFLNEKSIIQPLLERFEQAYRQRFNALLEQALHGYEAGTRRGAAQSAALWVENFVEAEVLTFTVCDPAMGSGHFLVNAANQMAGLVVDLLAEIPFIEGMALANEGAPNAWRRRITRHCVYGVDLNPLAVNLAKLSLWLNCFAGEHKLTFLDHHVRCGNSLIGIRSLDDLAAIPERKKDSRKQKDLQGLLFEIDDLSEILKAAAADASAITRIDEDDTDLQKALFSDVSASAERLRPLADLYTAYLMDPLIAARDYRELFEILATERTLDDTLNFSLPEVQASVEGYRERHAYFHWPLEFPDVFGPDAVGGFSAAVGNPPWDTVKPNSQEFYSDYDPGFRSYKKQQANRISKKLMADNPSIAKRWQAYCDAFSEQSTYFSEPASYSARGTGDINTYKLFLEQFFALLNNAGSMGIVVPSGLYTDQGCQPLRERFFDKSRIEFLYCFENRRAIFNIHRSFKFVLFGAQKGGKTGQFKCAFMEHNPERLPVMDANALRMRVQQVRKFSPDSLSVMEFRSQQDIDITTHIYGNWPLLGEQLPDTWNVKFRSELHMTNDSHLFRSLPTDCPLYEGKMIWHFDSAFDSPRYWLDREEVVSVLGDNAWEGGHYRVGFRNIAASTNERTLICGISPPSFHGNSFLTITPKNRQWNGPDESETVWIASVLSSLCIDFLIRQKVSTNLNYFYIESLPVQRIISQNKMVESITARATRLFCFDKSFAVLWEQLYLTSWQSPEFWYPPDTPIDTYGPIHEQEIRKRLRDEATKLTPEWGPHCGVHDRLPDRRDTGDRAQLRAEIDAYVAHMYGLSRDDFAYILDTFPVLERKEIKAFGEYMSKRKCLEEYDRIGKILQDSAG